MEAGGAAIVTFHHAIIPNKGRGTVVIGIARGGELFGTNYRIGDSKMQRQYGYAGHFQEGAYGVLEGFMGFF